MHKFIYSDEVLTGDFDALKDDIDPSGSGRIVDNGIGHYEFGGATGIHHDYGVELDEDIQADVSIIIQDADIEESILEDAKEIALEFVTGDMDICRYHTWEPSELDWEECSRSAARTYECMCSQASGAEFELQVFNVKYVKELWYKRLFGKTKGILTFSIGWE